MKFEVIKTGSKGNCVIFENYLAVDMGISFSNIKESYKDLKIVLLTHSHG